MHDTVNTIFRVRGSHRASDQQHGKRSTDLTSPAGTGTLHVHWIPVLMLLAIIAACCWWLGAVLGPRFVLPRDARKVLADL